ncbi:hypothetical protein GOBAR_AA30116 [Gossypium barbadense]|uniref:Uncharacterized protein n=1 Tax=Gossypium barbadense TaxID=3634 RepID=A0A2P5WHK5_GOSBA|nr:hypothetical protein GOBAR_AA30116 [Gossypium barbadense]
MLDLPLRFGIVAKRTQDCRKLDPNAIVVLHRADIGEYLRMKNQTKHLGTRTKFAHPGNRTPVSTVGGYYDTTTLDALC